MIVSDTQDERPWYRQFWPWFIAFPPAAAVVGGLVTAWLAGTGPSLVVDDYGQIGKVTAERAYRDERAAELALRARLGFASAEAGETTVQLELAGTGELPEYPTGLRLQLVHPTQAERDAEVVLTGSRGRYTGRIVRPVGRLYVHLGDVERTWRLTGELAASAREIDLVPDGSVASR